MDKELEERFASKELQERIAKWKEYSSKGLCTLYPAEDISDIGRLIEKYQKKFNDAIENRNEASHEAVKTGNRDLWNKYNIEAFILIDVLYDLRYIHKQPKIDIDYNYPSHNLRTVSVLNTEDYFPLDGDDL